MKLHHLLAAGAALLALVPGPATAQTSAVPNFISYQGRVVDAAGNNVGAPTPVNRTVIFRIWDSPSSTNTGNLIYSEAQTVTVSDGEFSVLVGQGVANPTQTFGYPETAKKLPDLGTAFDGKDRYLGVTVASAATIAGTDNEITPRQQIVSTAFAMRAKFAESIGSSSDLALTPLSGTASNYGLGWYGAGRLFNNTTVDGPVLYGNAGGALGSNASGTRNTALRWDASGRVGIGATSITSTTNKLTLQGDMTTTPGDQLTIRGNADNNKRLLLGYDTTANKASLQSYTAAATTGQLLLNPSGGNVGVNNTAPSVALDVTGAIKASTSIAANGNNGHVFSGTGDADGGLFSPADGTVTIKTDNTERVRVTSLGRVGIGTTIPSVALDVTGAIKASGDLTAANVSTTQITANSRVMTNSLEFWSPGNLGALFKAGAGAFPTNSSAASGEMVLMGSPKLHLATANGGAAVMTLSGSNVGIGKKDPNAALDVVKATTGISQEFAFRVDKNKDSVLSSVLTVRTFGSAGPYNLELGEGQAFKPGGGAWGVFSDRRLKKDILPLDGALERLLKLKSATFKYKDPKKSHQFEGTQIGFIAQEVEEVFPEWVTENGEGYKVVSIRGFESLTVQALRELRAEKDAEIQALRDENTMLRRELAAKEASLEARLIALERRMSSGEGTETVSLKTAKAGE